MPWAIANAAFKRQRKNQAVTEIEKLPTEATRSPSTMGWREVADRSPRLRKRLLTSSSPLTSPRHLAERIVPPLPLPGERDA